MSSIFYGRPLAIAFLDMDGVMSDRLYNQKTQWAVGEKFQRLLLEPRYRGHKGEYVAMKRAQAACLHRNALERLHSLAERVEALGLRLVFVISSAWREFLTTEELKKDVFADEPWLAQRILDKTPDDDNSCPCLETYGFRMKHYRGRQIEYWLRENCEIWDIYSYVILDDMYSSAGEFDRHPGRFVCVDPDRLFSKKDEDEALDALTVPIPREPLAGIAVF